MEVFAKSVWLHRDTGQAYIARGRVESYRVTWQLMKWSDKSEVQNVVERQLRKNFVYIGSLSELTERTA